MANDTSINLHSYLEILHSMSIMFLLGAIISLPFLIAMELRKLRKLFHYMCAALLAPFYISFVLAIKENRWDWLSTESAAILIPFSCLYALIFWRIAIKPLSDHSPH